MHVYCVLLFYLCMCGKEMKERGQGGPSGLVPIWHGVDPTARNTEDSVAEMLRRVFNRMVLQVLKRICSNRLTSFSM
jgi:hypothetical protein